MSFFPQALFLVPPSEISFISFFQLTPAFTSQPGHCYRFYWARFFLTSHLHASLLYQRILTMATAATLTLEGKTCVAPLLPGYGFFLYFSYWFTIGEKRLAGFWEEKGEKESRKELAEKMYSRQGKISPLFAAPRSYPFLQHRKTYRWNKTALRRRSVWFRCDIILPPSSTTSFFFLLRIF